MRKNATKLCSLLIALLLFSQCRDDSYYPCIHGSGSEESESRLTADFSGVHFELEGTVEIRKASRYEVVLQGHRNHLEKVKTEVKGKTLKVYSDRCLKDSRLHVVVYTPQFDELRLAGSGKGYVRDSFDADEMQFDLSGSGTAETVDQQAEQIRARISGSGELVLRGDCTQLQAEISGSGSVRAFNLHCSDLDGRISGSGNIETSVSRRIDAHISGSGSIRYSGSPATVNTQISGSGKVVKVN